MNQWNTPVYAHPTPIIQPPEQMDLGIIDKWWVMSQEQSYMNARPNIMLSAKNPTRVAAQRNLMRDPSKILKSLKEFCPLAYNPIILYKPPYLDNQELVKKYMGRATICPTMELGWEESNSTPLPPTVPAMPTSPAPTVPAMPTPSAPTVPAMPTPLAPTVPAMAQMTPPPTLPVKMDMMTTHGLVPNSNNNQNISADTIIFDDSDSEHPGIDINYAGPSSSKHNTSSNSSSSGYSGGIRDAADEPQISPGTIFKQQL